MRYFLQIAYDGTKFKGWQRQPNVPSVQQTIEECFSTIYRRKVVVWGCGRTDAGVHAKKFFAHIDFNEELTQNAVFRINLMLPNSIIIQNYFEVPKTLHAQRSATSRTYDYYISLEKKPFNTPYISRYYFDDLDQGKMEKAVSLLMEYKEYRSFCKQPDLYKHTLCNIFKSEISFGENNTTIHFHIVANRFLRGMIRLLMARILEVGTLKVSLSEFESYLNEVEETKLKTRVYAQGLFLSDVTYDFDFK